MTPRYSNLPSSMLPFIDLLSNVIGSLCMIILVASLSQGLPDQAPSTDGTATQIEQSTHRIQSDARALRDSITAARQREAELQQQADATTAQAMEQRESLDAQLIDLASVGAGREDYRRKIAELEDRRAGLTDLLKSLRDQLAQRRPSSMPNEKIEIHFVGQGRSLKPTFVECTAMGIAVYTATGREIVDRSDIKGSDAVQQIMNTIKTTPQGTLIFLVRPDGLKTLGEVELLADHRMVRHGKLPIPGERVLDFGPYAPSGTPVDRKEN